MDKLVVYGMGYKGREFINSICEFEKELDINIIALVDKAVLSGRWGGVF